MTNVSWPASFLLEAASARFFRGLRESAPALPWNGEAAAALAGAHRTVHPLRDCYGQRGAGRPIA